MEPSGSSTHPDHANDGITSSNHSYLQEVPDVIHIPNFWDCHPNYGLFSSYRELGYRYIVRSFGPYGARNMVEAASTASNQVQPSASGIPEQLSECISHPHHQDQAFTTSTPTCDAPDTTTVTIDEQVMCNNQHRHPIHPILVRDSYQKTTGVSSDGPFLREDNARSINANNYTHKEEPHRYEESTKTTLEKDGSSDLSSLDDETSARPQRPQPRLKRKLGGMPRHIKDFPPGSEALPAGLSLSQICRRYPNHLYDDYLRSFIKGGWDAKDIWANMEESAKVSASTRRPWNAIEHRLNRVKRKMKEEEDGDQVKDEEDRDGDGEEKEDANNDGEERSTHNDVSDQETDQICDERKSSH
jgi:hypothetical protein